MRDDTPTVYLLAGPSGSGKSTYARALESEGVTLLGIDPARAREGHLAQDLAVINERLVAEVEAGRDVVLDHGLGQGADRDFYKSLVERHGGQWCLINFNIDHTELIRRLDRRNRPAPAPLG